MDTKILIAEREVTGALDEFRCEYPELSTPAERYGHALKPVLDKALQAFLGKAVTQDTIEKMRYTAQAVSDSFWHSSEEWSQYPKPDILLGVSPNPSMIQWGVRPFPSHLQFNGRWKEDA